MYIEITTTITEIPLTGGHIPFIELWITTYTLSKEHVVSRLYTIIFDPKSKWIYKWTESISSLLEIFNIQEVPLFKVIDEMLELISSINVVASMASQYNI